MEIMDLTQNFTLEELIKSDTANKYKIDNSPDEKIIKNLKLLCENILQPIRDRYAKPITVTSGYRCDKLNKKVGGVKTSQHLNGEAADLICDDKRKLNSTDYNIRKENECLFLIIQDMIKKGEIKVRQLINENNFSWIHVSLPTNKLKNQIIKI